ncbi:hypothetical protein BH23ACT8_BH23ACT8_04360 [soil metagenome]
MWFARSGGIQRRMQEPDRGAPRPEDRDSGGAGRGGGLLFVAVLLFCAYLALTALAGILRVVAALLLALAAAALLANVLRRR